MRALAVAVIASLAGCGDDGATAIDAAAVDAAAVDSRIAACTGDHVERLERQNDPALGGTIEETGLSLAGGGAPIAVCGELAAGDADADFYALAVEGDADVPVRVELRAADAAAGAIVSVWGVTGSGRVFLLAAGRLLGPVAVAVTPPLPPGTYAVSVSAPAGVAEPIGYELAVAESAVECPTATAAPDHEESGDGGDDRGNDAVAVSFTPVAEFALTSGGGDDPEATGLSLAAGDVVRIAGESAARASAGDDYRDRDSYELTTGADAAELEIRLAWPHGGGTADLDLFLFRGSGVDPELTLGAGSLVGAGFDEVVTVRVDPVTTYWIWVGGFDRPGAEPAASYDITICGR